MAKNISMKTSDFKKLLKKLKGLEEMNPSAKIGKFATSKFMIAAANPDDIADSPEIRTKRIILQIAGDFDTNPATLSNSLSLKLNLQYGDDEYSVLQMRLNKLVKSIKASASIDDDETGDCKIVKDCVTLVNDKIS